MRNNGQNEVAVESRGERPEEVVESLLLKAARVAKALDIGRSTAYQLMESGELPTVRIGRSVRVPRDRLLQWIAERTR